MEQIIGSDFWPRLRKWLKKRREGGSSLCGNFHNLFLFSKSSRLVILVVNHLAELFVIELLIPGDVVLAECDLYLKYLTFQLL